MSNISLADFRVLFDEFASVVDAKINAYLVIASNRVAPAVWGSNASYATALLTAHMIASSGGSGGIGGGAGGPLTNEQVGDLSRGYSTVGMAGSGDQELQTTRYGQEYIALRRETVIGGFTLGGGHIGDTPDN